MPALIGFGSAQATCRAESFCSASSGSFASAAAVAAAAERKLEATHTCYQLDFVTKLSAGIMANENDQLRGERDNGDNHNAIRFG